MLPDKNMCIPIVGPFTLVINRETQHPILS